jgi:hypothetical protein
VTARRMPNGLLRPELADLLEGARVAELLGLDPSQIPHKALTAMGAAVTDQRMADYQGPVYPNDGRDIELSPELEQALDQIEAKMQANPYPRWGTPEYAQAQGQDLEKVQTTPETHTNRNARADQSGHRGSMRLGQVDHAARGKRKKRVRNVLSETVDPPDEDWS